MENLKRLRENADLSQQGLANEIGLTQQKIHSYENDLYEHDIATLKQLANYFDTSVDYLIGNRLYCFSLPGIGAISFCYFI